MTVAVQRIRSVLQFRHARDHRLEYRAADAHEARGRFDHFHEAVAVDRHARALVRIDRITQRASEAALARGRREREEMRDGFVARAGHETFTGAEAHRALHAEAPQRVGQGEHAGGTERRRMRGIGLPDAPG